MIQRYMPFKFNRKKIFNHHLKLFAVTSSIKENLGTVLVLDAFFLKIRSRKDYTRSCTQEHVNRDIDCIAVYVQSIYKL